MYIVYAMFTDIVEQIYETITEMFSITICIIIYHYLLSFLSSLVSDSAE